MFLSIFTETEVKMPKTPCGPKLNIILLCTITVFCYVKAIPAEAKLKHGINNVNLQHHDGSIKSHKIFVDAQTDDNNWIVIQRRINNAVNFNRSWSEYKSGFGDLEGNFWIGNDALSAMTSRQPAVLRIDLHDCSGQQTYQIYKGFSVLPEYSFYEVRFLDSHNEGTAGDSLLMSGDSSLTSYSINGMRFSTYDRDYDNFCGSCAQMLGGGGFWYNKCSGANPNGIYYNACKYASPVMNGIDWFTWNSGREPYSLSKVEIKISWQEFLPTTGSSMSKPTTTPNCYENPWNWQCQQQCSWNPWEPWCSTTSTTSTTSTSRSTPTTTPNCNETPWYWQCQQQCSWNPWEPWCSTTSTSTPSPTTTPNCNETPWYWQCQQQCIWYPSEPWCPTSPQSTTTQTSQSTTTPNCYENPWNWQCQQQCSWNPWEPWCSTTSTSTPSPITTPNCYENPWDWQCQQQCNRFPWEPWCTMSTSTSPFSFLKILENRDSSRLNRANDKNNIKSKQPTKTEIETKSKLLQSIVKDHATAKLNDSVPLVKSHE